MQFTRVSSTEGPEEERGRESYEMFSSTPNIAVMKTDRSIEVAEADFGTRRAAATVAAAEVVASGTEQADTFVAVMSDFLHQCHFLHLPTLQPRTQSLQIRFEERQ